MRLLFAALIFETYYVCFLPQRHLPLYMHKLGLVVTSKTTHVWCQKTNNNNTAPIPKSLNGAKTKKKLLIQIDCSVLVKWLSCTPCFQHVPFLSNFMQRINFHLIWHCLRIHMCICFFHYYTRWILWQDEMEMLWNNCNGTQFW